MESASALVLPAPQLFIGNEWKDARDGSRLATVNPATEEVVAEVAVASREDVDMAVAVAREAFDSGPWPRMAAADRGALLWRIADLVEERAAQLAPVESTDTGKPITDVLRVDIPLAVAVLRYFAGFADKAEGESIPARAPGLNLTLREPIGVIGAIVPWNYPLLLAVYKLAPALAFGNTVVLKPAEETPLSILLFAEIAREAGLPAGVLNVIPGFGEVAGAALAGHSGIDKICFTGSTETGSKVMAAAAANTTKVQLELGGKSPNIIFADADLKGAVKGAAFGVFSNMGEICTAGSRLLVERSVHDEVVDGLTQSLSRFRQGNPLDPKTRMGPLISGAHRARVQRYVDVAKAEGARLVAGGEAGELPRGYYFKPTIFCGVTNGMRIGCEEVFGPVLSVLSFDGVEDLIAQANDTIYGLAAGVWSRDVKKALGVAKALRAGTVWVNTYNMYDPTMPFGGVKRSGFGRELGRASLEEYTQRKSVWLAL